MNFTVVLIFWTLTGVQGDKLHYDWRPIGEFANKSACVAAATELKLKPVYFKCLDTQMKERR